MWPFSLLFHLHVSVLIILIAGVRAMLSPVFLRMSH